MPESDLDEDVRELLVHSGLHTFDEQVQGPYHRPVHPERRDIVEDRVGYPLRIGLRLLRGADRVPATGVEIEVWQADKDGRYSGFSPSPFKPGDTVTSQTVPIEVTTPDESFLRGRQRTDAAGMCQFDTIYPGWYPSRTIHIHLIAHLSPEHHLVTQLYFSEDVTNAVFARPPYSERPVRDTMNADDSIFLAGDQSNLMSVIDSADGMIGALNLILPG